MKPLIIEMPTRVDGGTVPDLRKQVDQAFDSDHPLVVFDFKSTSFMDSMGLSIIVSALKKSGRFKKKLRLVHVGKEVKMLLQITRFDRICDIHETMKTALAL